MSIFVNGSDCKHDEAIGGTLDVGGVGQGEGVFEFGVEEDECF